MNSKSFENYEFRPKLSKHELILERYITILNSTSNNNNTENYSNVVSIEKSLRSINTQDDIINNLLKLNKENVKFNLGADLTNNVLYSKSENMNMANTGKYLDVNITKNNSRDYIDQIKNKYTQNANNNNKINNINIISDRSAGGVNNSIMTNLINQTNTNNEVEMIKSKYIKNVNKPDISNIEKKIAVNLILEEKLLKYKKEFEKEKIEVTNISLYNKIEEEDNRINDSVLLNRLSILEEKINQLNTTNNQLISYKNIDKINLNLIESEAKEKSLSESLSISLSQSNIKSIEEKISKLKLLKQENNTLELNKNNKECINKSGEILNKMIESITGQLFSKFDNTIIKNMTPSSKIKVEEPKTKFFKIRANSAPRKKITSFEEFIQIETNNSELII